MSEGKKEKLVIVVTHSGEDPEKATLPFVVGNAALAMEVEATIILQSNGVMVAVEGCSEHIFAAGFDPLKKLVDSFLDLGGTLLVCIPCLESRKIGQEQVISRARPAKAGRVVQEMLEATSVVSY